MESPSGRVPERAPVRFLVATEVCGGGTSDLSSVLEVLGYESIYRCRGTSEELQGPHEAGARALRGGAPHPHEHLPYLLTWSPSLSGGFRSKNNFSS